MANHQKSHTTFTGGFHAPNSFDARKTFQNQMNASNQHFHNEPSNTMQPKTQVIKKTNQAVYRQFPNNTQAATTSNGAHQLHRRILSQQNPLDGSTGQSNMDQFVNQSDMGGQNLASSGKIVVINNNNTNINIHQ